MNALYRISVLLARCVELVGKLAAWLAVPLMLIILYDVVTRKYMGANPDFVDSFLNIGSTKLQESQWHIHSVLFLLTLGYVYTQNKQVRVELVREMLAPRTRAWIEMLGCLLFLLPYCIFVISYGYAFAERSFLMGEGSAAQTGLQHRWLIKATLPVGFLLLAFAGLSVLLRNAVYLFGPDDLREASGTFVESDSVRELLELAEKELEEDARHHPEHKQS